jgi:penicillin-insensitive murein endopeptidase
VIGEVAGGCLAGGVRLPQDGIGYAVVRLARNRYYGHPSLIRYIQALGSSARLNRLGSLYIGDLSQPRGGPMAFGHSSHQNGLDADIWFNLKQGPVLFARTDLTRELIQTPSMLNFGRTGLDYTLWTPRHAKLLEVAARLPAVDRIFVNPHIKRELCRTVRYDRSWLRKIRPWHWHDDHFHVRLTCPEDSIDCIQQAPVPAGDGCDEGLSWWLGLRIPAIRPRPSAPRPVRLPEHCASVLYAD